MKKIPLFLYCLPVLSACGASRSSNLTELKDENPPKVFVCESSAGSRFDFFESAGGYFKIVKDGKIAKTTIANLEIRQANETTDYKLDLVSGDEFVLKSKNDRLESLKHFGIEHKCDSLNELNVSSMKNISARLGEPFTYMNTVASCSGANNSVGALFVRRSLVPNTNILVLSMGEPRGTVRALIESYTTSSGRDGNFYKFNTLVATHRFLDSVAFVEGLRWGPFYADAPGMRYYGLMYRSGHFNFGDKFACHFNMNKTLLNTVLDGLEDRSF